jgi:hypothetical protein
MTPENPSSQYERAPGLSIASLVIGVVSICGGFLIIVPSILAIIFGHVSRGECKRRNIQAGMGMALAGLVMG